MNSFRNRVLFFAGVIATFAFPVFAETYNITGTVISVTPQYRNVTVPVDLQDCRNVEVPVYGNAQNNGNAGEGALLGMIIGGVIGDAVSGGNGDTTAAGAVIGGIIGANNAQNGTRQVVTGYRTERQCTTRTVNDTRRELTDYRITYEVLGVEQTANVTTPYRVGDSIPVRVTIGLR